MGQKKKARTSEKKRSEKWIKKEKFALLEKKGVKNGQTKKSSHFWKKGGEKLVKTKKSSHFWKNQVFCPAKISGRNFRPKFPDLLLTRPTFDGQKIRPKFGQKKTAKILPTFSEAYF